MPEEDDRDIIRIWFLLGIIAVVCFYAYFVL